MLRLELLGDEIAEPDAAPLLTPQTLTVQHVGTFEPQNQYRTHVSVSPRYHSGVSLSPRG
jgi:hypothetical protein